MQRSLCSNATKNSTSRIALICSLFLLSFQAITSQVQAQTSIPSTFSTSQIPTATTSCVNGDFANNWSSDTLTTYWQYAFNASAFTNITFSTPTSSSSTGPHLAYMFYDNGDGTGFHKFNPLTNAPTYTIVGNSCSASGVINVPAAVNGHPLVKIQVRMVGASGSTGTNRVNTNGVLSGVNATPCATPGKANVILATDSFCVHGSETLSFTDTNATNGISYQWDSSTSATGPFFAVTGAGTGTSYTTPSVTATTFYQVKTTCAVTGNSVTSNVASLVIKPAPTAGHIVGLTATPLAVGTVEVLHIVGGPAGGTWASSAVSTATVTPSFTKDSATLKVLSGGASDISYEVTGANGCTAFADTDVVALFPNTLALYAGINGTSVQVFGLPGETVTNLAKSTAANDTFGTNTPCSTGGFSGITVPVADSVFTLADTSSFPYLTYTATANVGKVLNVLEMHAVTRESATGPQEARLVYRVNGTGPWVMDSAFAQFTGGDCGANSNSWFWTLGGPTLTGVKRVDYRIYPYKPQAAGGTFQLNQLELIGNVTDSVLCTSTSIAGHGGTVTPAHINICDTGVAFMSTFDTANNFTGIAGLGITYQWDSATTVGGTYFPVHDGIGATSVAYHTPKLFGTERVFYKLVTTCAAAAGSTTVSSTSDTVNVTSTTSATITSSGFGKYVEIGGANAPTFVGGTIPAGGSAFWTSGDTSVLSLPHTVTTGTATSTIMGTPLLPGYAPVELHITANGCTATKVDTVKVIDTNSIAVYLGHGGNSTLVDTIATGATPSHLSDSGYGAASLCGSGGISGLTNNGVLTFATNHAWTEFTITPNAGQFMAISGFHTTLRKSGSGPDSVRLAYSVNGGATWIDEGKSQTVLTDDCGFSSRDNFWSFANPAAPALPMFVSSPVIFRLYGFNPTASGGTLQVNSIDITGAVAPKCANAMGNYIEDAAGENANTNNPHCNGAMQTWSGANGGGDLNFWYSNNPSVLTFDATNATAQFATSTQTPPNVGTVTLTNTMYFASANCLIDTFATFNVTNCSLPPNPRFTNGVATVNNTTDVTLYPNPATQTVNIQASEAVNVIVMSIDGKELMNVKNAQSINVSNLASGLYIVNIYDAKNAYIKTVKITKQ